MSAANDDDRRQRNAPDGETDWIGVCSVDDIPVRGARRVARGQAVAVVLFRTATDAVHALLDRCPHRAGPLSQGIVSDDGVTCPLHGQFVEFESGCVRAPDEGCTPRFATRVDPVSRVVSLDRHELETVATGADLLPAMAPGRQRVVSPAIRKG